MNTIVSDIDLFELIFGVATDLEVAPIDENLIGQPEIFTGTPASTPPAPLRNHVISPGDILFPQGAKTQVAVNIRAVRLLKQLQAECRPPTIDECKVLVQYSGWGGHPQVFDVKNEEYRKYHDDLKSVLDDEEYASARASTLSAHYTPEFIIDFMWKLARICGFQGGEVGEFGAGVGHFIGLCPSELSCITHFHAVEIDNISSSILKTLYPEVNLYERGLEKTYINSESLDLVIGNVPFSQQGVYDKRYPNFNLHNYFIARALDALKPGGFCVVLTSNSTMDSNSCAAREYFLQRASLLTAYRLPNSAFKISAGTEVVSDILIFRKGVSNRTAFLNVVEMPTGDNTGSVKVNEYYAAYPANIFGWLSNTGRMYGNVNSPTVLPDDTGLADLLRQYQPNFEIPEYAGPVNDFSIFDRSEPQEEITVDRTLRDYAIFQQENTLYQYIGSKGILLGGKNGKRLTGNECAKGFSFIKLKDALNDLLHRQIDPEETDETIEYQRGVLNELYDDHIRRYGHINNKAVHRLYIEDPDYLKLAATEQAVYTVETSASGVQTKRRKFVKSDIYHKRTQWPWREPVSAVSPAEAGMISYAYRHRIDLEYIARLLSLESAEEAENAILSTGEFFKDPVSQVIELKSAYLSGNVVRKLVVAENAAKEDSGYLPNVEALITVQPKPLQIDEIDFILGSYWIPAELVEKWITAEFNDTVTVKYTPAQDKWTVAADYRAVYNHPEYTVGNLNLYKLIEMTLNLQEPVIHKDIYELGEKKVVVDQEATLTVRQFKKELTDKFHTFILNDLESIRKIESVYNSIFNNHVLRQYECPGFEVYPGAVSIVNDRKFILRPHQKRAVSRCLEGNTLLAHCVGAGKTAIMVTTAMELRRLKLATKCLIVVQNATLTQFAEFAPRLYPEARILVADKKDLVKEKRKRFMARIATGDWDMVIMAQSSFDMIADDPDEVITHFNEQIGELEAIIEEAESRDSVKDIERQKCGLEKQLEKLLDKERVEDIVYFNELGVDALFIDEAHAYKRNFFVTKKDRVKGLDRGSSKRAFSLSLKIKHIRQKTGGRNIFFATGTPVTNTIAEIWNMVRYVSPETLAEYGIETFDRFASTFTGTEIALEIDAAGRFRMVERFARYCNAIELSKMFRSCADVVLSDDLGDVERPPIRGGHPEKVNIPRSPHITQFVRYLADVYNWFENSSDKREISHIPLLIYGLSRKCTIDLRLICAGFPDDPDSKLNVCAGKIVEKYHHYSEIKGAQIVFMDLYRNSLGSITLFDAWEELRCKLVANGIPIQEIAVINDCTTDKQRNELFDKVNSGEVRVIIGSTSRLGTGVNIQERLAVAHHLDAPFRPSDMEQRNGRIIRQGNILKEVEIIQYGVEQTLDAGMYQILERKQRFINDAMIGRCKRTLEELNDDVSLDYAAFSAMISGNEKMQRKVVIETRLKELEALEAQYRRNHRNNLSDKSNLETQIPVYERELEHFSGYCSRLGRQDFSDLSIQYGETRIMGSKAEIRAELQHILLHKGIYPVIEACRVHREDMNIPLGELTVNGYVVQLTASCRVTSGGYADSSTARIHFRLKSMDYQQLNANVSGKSASGKELFSDIIDVIRGLPESQLKARRTLAAMQAKLDGLKNFSDKGFQFKSEQTELVAELSYILVELNKTNPEFGSIRVVTSCPKLFDYFPELKSSLPNIIADPDEITDDECDEFDPVEAESA